MPVFPTAYEAEMRYRDLCQGVSSCRSARGSESGIERSAMFRHGVDGEQQFVHAGHERNLGQFATREQALVMGAQPWVVANGAQCRHPQGGTKSGIAEGSQNRHACCCVYPIA